MLLGEAGFPLSGEGARASSMASAGVHRGWLFERRAEVLCRSLRKLGCPMGRVLHEGLTDRQTDRQESITGAVKEEIHTQEVRHGDQHGPKAHLA